MEKKEKVEMEYKRNGDEKKVKFEMEYKKKLE